MGKKLKKSTSKGEVPGANYYSPNKDVVSQSSPRVITFQGKRVDFSKSLTGEKLGPGSYQVDKNGRS